MKRLDIAIAGCGIAGLSSALLLQRQGHQITLYDRFSSPQPLGSGLMIQPTGMAVLSQMGLAEKALAHGAPIRALYGENSLGEAVLEADYSDLGMGGLFGLGIHRASLFFLLYEAAIASGVIMETDHPISRSELRANRRLVFFENEQPVRDHDLLVDTMGVGSSLVPPHEAWLKFGALWTTLPWPENGPFDEGLLEQRYEAAFRMIGVLPTGKRWVCDGSGSDTPDFEGRELSFFWSLRCADYAQWQEDGMDAWKRQVSDLWPECEGLLGHLTDPADMTFARYAHRTLAQPIGERLIHIGDAWHCASPQLGQGANMALLDAWALAKALGGAETLADGLDSAIKLRRDHVRLYQVLTAAFTPVYQSDSMWPAALRDIVLAPASRLGPAPRMKSALVAGLAGSPLKRLGLSLADHNVLAAGRSNY